VEEFPLGARRDIRGIRVSHFAIEGVFRLSIFARPSIGCRARCLRLLLPPDASQGRRRRGPGPPPQHFISRHTAENLPLGITHESGAPICCRLRTGATDLNSLLERATRSRPSAGSVLGRKGRRALIQEFAPKSLDAHARAAQASPCAAKIDHPAHYQRCARDFADRHGAEFAALGNLSRPHDKSSAHVSSRIRLVVVVPSSAAVLRVHVHHSRRTIRRRRCAVFRLRWRCTDGRNAGAEGVRRVRPADLARARIMQGRRRTSARAAQVNVQARGYSFIASTTTDGISPTERLVSADARSARFVGFVRRRRSAA